MPVGFVTATGTVLRLIAMNGIQRDAKAAAANLLWTLTQTYICIYMLGHVA